MKNLLSYLLVATVCWQAYEHFSTVTPARLAPTNTASEHIPATDHNVSWAPQPVISPTMPTPEPASQFKCDGRTHCSQMTSRAEAKFFLQHCPNTEMDGDNDGNPCERQFSFL